MTQKIQVEVTTLENKLIEIKGEVSAEVFEEYREGAVKRLGAEMEIDGFRKGNAPLSVIEKKVGEDNVLREMAEMAIAEHYPKILIDKNIDAIGQPLVSLTKLAKGNPLGFSIKTAVMPELILPDYKKIAKEKGKREDVEVADNEIADTLLRVRKMRAHQEMHEKGVEHDDHNPDNIKEEDLPPLNDETAKNFGPFEKLEDLKNAIKENIKTDKEKQESEKARVAILEEIIKETKTEIPDMLIEIETENMLGRLKYDLENLGSKFEDYLKNIKKTEEELRKEWREEAAKRATLQLVIEKIANEENITADKEAVDAEVKKVAENYPETNEVRARQYIEVTMRNEKVFSFLEEQAK